MLRGLQFPVCDGSHNEHNKESGDNVGPLVLKHRDKWTYLLYCADLIMQCFSHSVKQSQSVTIHHIYANEQG